MTAANTDDSSQWPKLGSEWDPDFKKLWAENPQPATELGDAAAIPHIRAAAHPMMKQGVYSRLDFAGVEQAAPLAIPVRDGTSIPALLFRPSSAPAAAGGGGAGPLAVLFHGGGFLIGVPELEALSAVPLVRECGATVVSVDYRLAPEHVFPTAVHDCWDALKWCAANASTLGADPSKGFLIGGSSAGGNLTAVLQHLARDEKLEPAVTAAWLAYPATCIKDTVPEQLRHEHTSEDQLADAPILTTQNIREITKNYQPDLQSDLFSPLNWASGHAGLTRTHIQVTGLDVLRDSGLMYERELRRSGVETLLHVYPGCPHGFDVVMPQLPAAKTFEEDRLKGFKWLLRQE